MHRPCQGPAIGLEKGLTSCLPPRTVGGGLEARKENLQEPPREPPPPPPVISGSIFLVKKGVSGNAN